MDCPYCQGKTQTIRSLNQGPWRSRKRRCFDCNCEFNTIEAPIDCLKSNRLKSDRAFSEMFDLALSTNLEVLRPLFETDFLKLQ